MRKNGKIEPKVREKLSREGERKSGRKRKKFFRSHVGIMAEACLSFIARNGL